MLGPEAQSQASQINRPYGAAWREGKLYVCDSGARRCAVFDFAARAFRTFGDQGPHRLALPINISLGAQGEKYVADTGLGAVLVFDSADQAVRSISLPEGMKPCDALWYDGALYVADLKSDSILVFDPESGRLLRRIGKAGDQPGEFHQPTNLAFGPDGSLYVSDTLNARVQKLDREGRAVQVIGSLGETVGQMVRPKGIAVDRDGRLYVADAATDSVQIYDSTGRLLLMLGGPGAGSGRPVSAGQGRLELRGDRLLRARCGAGVRRGMPDFRHQPTRPGQGLRLRPWDVPGPCPHGNAGYEE